jgi:hypothetical protein
MSSVEFFNVIIIFAYSLGCHSGINCQISRSIFYSLPPTLTRTLIKYASFFGTGVRTNSRATLSVHGEAVSELLHYNERS